MAEVLFINATNTIFLFAANWNQFESKCVMLPIMLQHVELRWTASYRSKHDIKSQGKKPKLSQSNFLPHVSKFGIKIKTDHFMAGNYIDNACYKLIMS